MKPFITPDVAADGRKLFRLQCEGLPCEDLAELLTGRTLQDYAHPVGHSLKAAWELTLFFDGNLALKFSSASTVVSGWQEVGSLNVMQSSDEAASAPGVRTSIEPLRLISVEKVVFEDDEVTVECGLVLRSANGEEVLITAGVSPGSVSVSAAFNHVGFSPQFPLSDCGRSPL